MLRFNHMCWSVTKPYKTSNTTVKTLRLFGSIIQRVWTAVLVFFHFFAFLTQTKSNHFSSLSASILRGNSIFTKEQQNVFRIRPLILVRYIIHLYVSVLYLMTDIAVITILNSHICPFRGKHSHTNFSSQEPHLTSAGEALVTHTLNPSSTRSSAQSAEAGPSALLFISGKVSPPDRYCMLHHMVGYQACGWIVFTGDNAAGSQGGCAGKGAYGSIENI